MAAKAKIAIVDDHEVILDGLESMLKSEGFDVIGKATSGKEAVSMITKKKPDVALIDIRLKDDFDGLMVLEKVKAKLPTLRAVMLSTYDNPTYVARAVALGAHDYCLKAKSRGDILAAVKRAVNNESPRSDSMISQTRKTMQRRREQEDTTFPITAREVQVLRHLALGLSNREIAYSLDISIETVKEHVQNLLRRMDASDRTQAAVRAIKKGLVN